MAPNPKPTVSHRSDADLKTHLRETDQLLRGEYSHAQVSLLKTEEKASSNIEAVEKNLPLPGHATAALLMQYQQAADKTLAVETTHPYEHLRMTPEQFYERRRKAASMGRPIN